MTNILRWLLTLVVISCATVAQGPPPLPPPPPFGEVLGRLDIQGVPSQERARLEKTIGLKVGRVLTRESFEKARDVVKKIDLNLSMIMTLDTEDKVAIRIAPRGR